MIRKSHQRWKDYWLKRGVGAYVFEATKGEQPTRLRRKANKAAEKWAWCLSSLFAVLAGLFLNTVFDNEISYIWISGRVLFFFSVFIFVFWLPSHYLLFVFFEKLFGRSAESADYRRD